MNLVNFNQTSLFSKKYQRQLLATLTGLIVAFSYGISIGWVTPMMYKLHSANSPLSFRISIEEASWIGSLTNVGGLCGTIFFGFIIDRVGRKICLYILPLPHIFFWIMVYYANNVYHLYLGRLIGGITGGGIFLIFPIFISEIADPQIRGTLGSLTALLTNVGALVGNIVASHVPYYIIPPLVLPLPIMSILFMSRSPETPQHLLRKGHLDKAKNSLQYYFYHKVNNQDDEDKINKKFVELKEAIELTNNQHKISSHNFINKSSFKGIAAGIVIVFINVFCGFYSITNYSSLIFAETKSSIDPYNSTIIMGVVMILGSYFASYFVDKFGRKILMMISSGSMTILLTTLGAYVYLTNRMELNIIDFLPVVLISLIIFAGSTGIAAITFVLLVEVLPPKVRSVGTTFCQIVMGVFAFGALKMFPILMVSIGLSSVMWIFAGVTAFGFLFFFFCIEETKCKSLDNNNAFN